MTFDECMAIECANRVWISENRKRARCATCRIKLSATLAQKRRERHGF